MVRVFTNGPEDLDSIPGRVILKTQKMVLDIQFIQTVLIQLIQFSISTDFLYNQLNIKTVL